MDEANETQDDFYQVPSQGGIPIKMTFEKRPFTPPFAQLIKMQACSNTGSRASMRPNSRQQSQIVQEEAAKTGNFQENIEEEIDNDLQATAKFESQKQLVPLNEGSSKKENSSTASTGKEKSTIIS